MFQGLHFYVTPSILPAPNAMKEIIECAGGKVSNDAMMSCLFVSIVIHLQGGIVHYIDRFTK